MSTVKERFDNINPGDRYFEVVITVRSFVSQYLQDYLKDIRWVTKHNDHGALCAIDEGEIKEASIPVGPEGLQYGSIKFVKGAPNELWNRPKEHRDCWYALDTNALCWGCGATPRNASKNLHRAVHAGERDEKCGIYDPRLLVW